VVYDNLKPAVQAILQGRRRLEQAEFTHFRSVYGFEAIFTNPASGWEKGSIENGVGYARRTYLVPAPQATSLAALNAWLRAACVRDQARVMRGQEEPIAARYAQEQERLLPLPAQPLVIGVVREVVVGSTAHVRFETNEYSVPVRYVGQRLTLRAEPEAVHVQAGESEVAAHARSYGRHQVVEDFRHYVPLLLAKSAAVPFASALRGGALPAAWEAFRQALVERHPEGNREFARVLSLCLTHPLAQVTAAVERAAAAGSYSADAVRQVLAWTQAPAAAPAPLDAVVYPAYQLHQAPPDVAAYNQLLPRREVGR
jgi:hypothetical protein